jgi:LysR family cys regulon transcriptional activator
MNFQQLRIIRETVRRGFNLTEVANALFTSQSGVSKHIKDLEDEIGVELFVRKGKRLLGLTPPGEELVGIVNRMLLDAENIKRLGAQFGSADEGELVVATTHTQARYALPKVVAAFKQAFPKVHLVLHECSPTEVTQKLLEGEADIGIATEGLASDQLVTFPYYRWCHGVIVPAGHALAEASPVTLPSIAQWPLVTYHEGFTGRTRIDAAFHAAGLKTDIVLSALDADVIKTYVELGLGVGIVHALAFDPSRDKGLRLLDGAHLFEANTTLLAARRGTYLRGFATHFIALCSPDLDEATVRKEVMHGSDGGTD